MHQWMTGTGLLLTLAAMGWMGQEANGQGGLPAEPLEIGLDQPQMFCDDYLVENRFNRRILNAAVHHVLHRGTPHPDNPLLSAIKPWEQGKGINSASIVYDERDSTFKAWYTVSPSDKSRAVGVPGSIVCYAESSDGIQWERPALDTIEWDGEKTNIVITGEQSAAAFALIDVPAQFRRGRRFVAYQRDEKLELVSSDDGIHWREESEIFPPRQHGDGYLTVLYDETQDHFVTFLRNHMTNFHSWDERLRGNKATGSTRYISIITSDDLWAVWDDVPRAVLIPGRGDADLFYGMPSWRYGGVFWGFLQHYDGIGNDTETLEVELVTSRDGIHWNRLDGKPMLIPYGEEGAWDAGMVNVCPYVVEVGDEWWLYYKGYGTYHNRSEEANGAVGLLKFRKEGFISIRSDGANDSYVVTRTLHWPGGDLYVNADATDGSLQVQVTDVFREPLAGFEYEQCAPLTGDHVRHRMQWSNADISELEGEIVRLEFKFKSADLFAFVAGRVEPATVSAR